MDFSRSAGRVWIFVCKQSPDHAIAFIPVCEPKTTTRGLMDITQFARHCGAGQVFYCTMNFHTLHEIKFKRHFCQCCAQLCGEPLTDEVLMNPIANFESLFTDSRMQTRTSEHAGFTLIEYSVYIIFAAVKAGAKLSYQLEFRFKRLRFMHSPGHERKQMFLIYRDGFL